MSPHPAHFRELLEELTEAEIEFILVGGLAVIAWGYVRGTKDIDLVPNPDPANLERLAKLLARLGGKVSVGDRRLRSENIGTFLRAGDLTVVDTPLGRVDILQGLPTVPRYSELSKSAAPADIGGIEVQVCSLEDLLAMKRAAGRGQDLVDIDQLEIAHSEEE